MNIVSGFLANINEGKQYRPVDKYLELGRELLHATSHSMHLCKSTHYVILFLENEIRERVFAQLPAKQETWWYRNKSWNVYYYHAGLGLGDGDDDEAKTFHVVIEFNKTDLFLDPYRPWISRFELITDNPTKDTLNYCLVQSQKMEWLRMAVVWQREQRNVDALQYPFVWMDFGIRHSYGNDGARFSHDIQYLYSSFDSCHLFSNAVIQWKPYHHTHTDDEISVQSFEGPLGQKGMTLPANRGAMHFGHCPRWGPEEIPLFLNEGYDLYKRVGWLIAGGVFAGDADTVEMFAGIYYEKCLQIITERQSIMWEVNVLAILYTEQPQWFSFYGADHNPSLIRNLFDSRVIHLC
jgi:hypothetical protein